MLSLLASVRCVFVVDGTGNVPIVGVALGLIAAPRLAIDLIVIRFARLLGDFLG
jgi:hypothetical protein